MNQPSLLPATEAPLIVRKHHLCGYGCKDQAAYGHVEDHPTCINLHLQCTRCPSSGVVSTRKDMAPTKRSQRLAQG